MTLWLAVVAVLIVQTVAVSAVAAAINRHDDRERERRGLPPRWAYRGERRH